MKLVRYGPAGKEKPGIIDKNGKLRSLAKIIPDITPETLAAGAINKIKKAKIEKLSSSPASRASARRSARSAIFRPSA